MNIDTFALLYDYNYWAHGKVLQHVAPLSDEQRNRQFEYSIGSIHEQLVHVMSAEWIWFERLNGNIPEAMLAPKDFTTLEAVRTRWNEIEANARNFIDGLSEKRLSQTIVYRTTRGTSHEQTVAGILLHVINHGTDHRAQILQLIHQLGGTTEAQDLIFYLRGA